MEGATEMQSECEDLILPSGDWLDRYFQQLYPPDSFVKRWNLNWNCWITLYCDSKGVRLHIREYVEKKNSDYVPTRNGVVLTPGTWYDFTSKIGRFNDIHNEASFIANNQLLVMCDNRHCNMQQIFKEGERFVLKNCNIYLLKEQVDSINCMVNEINASVVECIYNQHLPNILLISKPQKCLCTVHSSREEMRIQILQLVYREVNANVRKFYVCFGCIQEYSSQMEHECKTVSSSMQYISVGEKALFHVNIKNIVQNVFKHGCCCSCTEGIFSNLRLEDYERYIEQKYSIE